MPTLGYLLTKGGHFFLSSLSLFIRVPQALGIVSPSLGHRVPTAWSLPPQPLGIVCPILLGKTKSSDDDFTYFAIGVTYDADSRTRAIEASSIERVISYDAILFARHDVMNA